MKRSLKLLFFSVLFGAASAQADTYVRGYTRSNGTYVQPHYRSDSNDTKLDNWSTRGNTNPYTGKSGYKDPYDNSGSSYNSRSSFDSSYGGSNSWDD